MKIAITGSTGMVGQRLVQTLSDQGHEIFRVIRSRNAHVKEPTISWDPEKQFLDLQQLNGMDVVIHLAGENISKRWTKRQKEKIEQSRVQGTKFLSSSLAQLKNPPKCLLSASAIHYYGNHPYSKLLDENSVQGTGFLSEVVQQWEDATKPAEEKGIRVVHMRFGVILDKNAGALKKMLLPFQLGLGGKIGTGRQAFSWIALDEIPDIIQFLIEKEELKGAVNIVSPEPVTNYRFTKILGSILNRPTVLPIPALLLKAIYGEMAEQLLVDGIRVSSKKLINSGYTFEYSDLKRTLEHMFNN
ncbi:TIGR01777 family oxidoreductase [Shimazuella sp. AN120528]|uniref:TIGR01777 family oxidoreductase n=1 Tax=Shimazuella soli TaxID=1892854 RepID=UPI001F112056|nr:TIGR01777 family oxidoreductase [Shimazuella soli]MCH5585676.1 TIGR01777 family oxidoreductase [Shimazuella soli]